MRITMLGACTAFVDLDRVRSGVQGTPKPAIWQHILPGMGVRIE